MEIKDEYLIERAESIIAPKKLRHGSAGDVGCALLTDKNNIYTGVCIDAVTGGFCAEHAAVSSMVANGEYRIKKIVAVWKDKKGKSHILPPCGRCREFISQINKKNAETSVIIGKNKKAKLKALLPHPWESIWM